MTISYKQRPDRPMLGDINILSPSSYKRYCQYGCGGGDRCWEVYPFFLWILIIVIIYVK